MVPVILIMFKAICVQNIWKHDGFVVLCLFVCFALKCLTFLIWHYTVLFFSFLFDNIGTHLLDLCWLPNP